MEIFDYYYKESVGKTRTDLGEQCLLMAIRNWEVAGLGREVIAQKIDEFQTRLKSMSRNAIIRMAENYWNKREVR